MTEPYDLRHINDLTRWFARKPRHLVALRHLLVPGSRSASLTARPVDICYGPGDVDTMDVDMFCNYGLLIRYKALPTTHKMSAAPDDGLCLTPFAISWLHAADKVMRAQKRKFLERTEVATFTIDPTTKSRKPVKITTWARIRGVHLSRSIHEIAAEVAAMAAKGTP